MRKPSFWVMGVALALSIAGMAEARDLGPWRLVGTGAARKAVWPSSGQVQIQAHCDAKRGHFVVRYRLSAADLDRFAPTERPLVFTDSPFEKGGRSVVMNTEIRPTEMVGRVRPSQRLVAILQAPYMAFDAPSEMDEPWYFGRSTPLATVARDCLKRAGG